ncbi:unnamed protein product [Amoebophrya sp. A120]|nr:unnamed protein product [Amoebophrya sp. A120]|eukprot:GSA120T00015016001.1
MKDPPRLRSTTKTREREDQDLCSGKKITEDDSESMVKRPVGNYICEPCCYRGAKKYARNRQSGYAYCQRVNEYKFARTTKGSALMSPMAVRYLYFCFCYHYLRANTGVVVGKNIHTAEHEQEPPEPRKHYDDKVAGLYRKRTSAQAEASPLTTTTAAGHIKYEEQEAQELDHDDLPQAAHDGGSSLLARQASEVAARGPGGRQEQDLPSTPGVSLVEHTFAMRQHELENAALLQRSGENSNETMTVGPGPALSNTGTIPATSALEKTATGKISTSKKVGHHLMIEEERLALFGIDFAEVMKTIQDLQGVISRMCENVMSHLLASLADYFIPDERVQEAKKSIAEFLNRNLSTLLASGAEIVIQFVPGLTMVFSKLFYFGFGKVIQRMIDPILDVIIAVIRYDALPTLFRMGLKLFCGYIWKFVKEKVDQLREMIPDWDDVTEMASDAAEAVAEKLGDAAKFAKDAINDFFFGGENGKSSTSFLSGAEDQDRDEYEWPGSPSLHVVSQSPGEDDVSMFRRPNKNPPATPTHNFLQVSMRLAVMRAKTDPHLRDRLARIKAPDLDVREAYTHRHAEARAALATVGLNVEFFHEDEAAEDQEQAGEDGQNPNQYHTSKTRGSKGRDSDLRRQKRRMWSSRTSSFSFLQQEERRNSDRHSNLQDLNDLDKQLDREGKMPTLKSIESMGQPTEQELQHFRNMAEERMEEEIKKLEDQLKHETNESNKKEISERITQKKSDNTARLKKLEPEHFQKTRKHNAKLANEDMEKSTALYGEKEALGTRKAFRFGAPSIKMAAARAAIGKMKKNLAHFSEKAVKHVPAPVRAAGRRLSQVVGMAKKGLKKLLDVAGRYGKKLMNKVRKWWNEVKQRLFKGIFLKKAIEIFLLFTFDNLINLMVARLGDVLYLVLDPLLKFSPSGLSPQAFIDGLLAHAPAVLRFQLHLLAKTLLQKVLGRFFGLGPEGQNQADEGSADQEKNRPAGGGGEDTSSDDGIEELKAQKKAHRDREREDEKANINKEPASSKMTLSFAEVINSTQPLAVFLQHLEAEWTSRPAQQVETQEVEEMEHYQQQARPPPSTSYIFRADDANAFAFGNATAATPGPFTASRFFKTFDGKRRSRTAAIGSLLQASEADPAAPKTTQHEDPRIKKALEVFELDGGAIGVLEKLLSYVTSGKLSGMVVKAVKNVFNSLWRIFMRAGKGAGAAVEGVSQSLSKDTNAARIAASADLTKDEKDLDSSMQTPQPGKKDSELNVVSSFATDLDAPPVDENAAKKETAHLQHGHGPSHDTSEGQQEHIEVTLLERPTASNTLAHGSSDADAEAAWWRRSRSEMPILVRNPENGPEDSSGNETQPMNVPDLHQAVNYDLPVDNDYYLEHEEEQTFISKSLPTDRGREEDAIEYDAAGAGREFEAVGFGGEQELRLLLASYLHTYDRQHYLQERGEQEHENEDFHTQHSSFLSMAAPDEVAANTTGAALDAGANMNKKRDFLAFPWYRRIVPSRPPTLLSVEEMYFEMFEAGRYERNGAPAPAASSTFAERVGGPPTERARLLAEIADEQRNQLGGHGMDTENERQKQNLIYNSSISHTYRSRRTSAHTYPSSSTTVLAARSSFLQKHRLGLSVEQRSAVLDKLGDLFRNAISLAGNTLEKMKDTVKSMVLKAGAGALFTLARNNLRSMIGGLADNLATPLSTVIVSIPIPVLQSLPLAALRVAASFIIKGVLEGFVYDAMFAGLKIMVNNLSSAVLGLLHLGETMAHLGGSLLQWFKDRLIGQSSWWKKRTEKKADKDLGSDTDSDDDDEADTFQELIHQEKTECDEFKARIKKLRQYFAHGKYEHTGVVDRAHSAISSAEKKVKKHAMQARQKKKQLHDLEAKFDQDLKSYDQTLSTLVKNITEDVTKLTPGEMKKLHGEDMLKGKEAWGLTLWRPGTNINCPRDNFPNITSDTSAIMGHSQGRPYGNEEHLQCHLVHRKDLLEEKSQALKERRRVNHERTQLLQEIVHELKQERKWSSAKASEIDASIEKANAKLGNVGARLAGGYKNPDTGETEEVGIEKQILNTEDDLKAYPPEPEAKTAARNWRNKVAAMSRKLPHRSGKHPTHGGGSSFAQERRDIKKQENEEGRSWRTGGYASKENAHATTDTESAKTEFAEQQHRLLAQESLAADAAAEFSDEEATERGEAVVGPSGDVTFSQLRSVADKPSAASWSPSPVASLNGRTQSSLNETTAPAALMQLRRGHGQDQEATSPDKDKGALGFVFSAIGKIKAKIGEMFRTVMKHITQGPSALKKLVYHIWTSMKHSFLESIIGGLLLMLANAIGRVLSQVIALIPYVRQTPLPVLFSQAIPTLLMMLFTLRVIPNPKLAEASAHANHDHGIEGAVDDGHGHHKADGHKHPKTSFVEKTATNGGGGSHSQNTHGHEHHGHKWHAEKEKGSAHHGHNDKKAEPSAVASVPDAAHVSLVQWLQDQAERLIDDYAKPAFDMIKKAMTKVASEGVKKVVQTIKYALAGGKRLLGLELNEEDKELLGLVLPQKRSVAGKAKGVVRNTRSVSKRKQP